MTQPNISSVFQLYIFEIEHIFVYNHCIQEWSPCEVMANVLNCILEVSEFEFRSRNCIYFQTNTYGKVMNSLIPLVMS